MKTINKVLLGLATASTILAPMVPKNVNININMEAPGLTAKEKPFKLVETQCRLANQSTTPTGMQVCEYHCKDGDKSTVYKTFRSNAVTCPDSTKETVKQTRR
jgi:hypothetical protein